MARELEIAAIDSVPAVLARRPQHTLPVGAPCPNCGTALAGSWCQACGQSSDDFHRSLAKLAGETLEGVFELDSRLWRTLPDLVLHPARLTRRYLSGHRVSQIPPFRMFLIVVVLVFLAAGLGPAKKPMIQLGGEPGAKQSGLQIHLAEGPRDPGGQWLTARLNAAAKDPVHFESVLTEWAQRLAMLLLPMSAALLGLMFFWRRDVYMFDHLIFSMHSLSFQGLLVAVVVAASQLSGWFAWLLLAAPIHLFVHLKGTYGLGVFDTLARMLVLCLGSLIGFTFALVGLVLIGLVETGQ
ncbi:MAG TPA: DUF3667 domain-containing protein [Caulobacteraceae bacterium]|jgi:hypothetical protein